MVSKNEELISYFNLFEKGQLFVLLEGEKFEKQKGRHAITSMFSFPLLF
jgi:hypothetical protein